MVEVISQVACTCIYFLYYKVPLQDLYHMLKCEIPEVLNSNAIFVECCPKGCDSEKSGAAYN